MPRKELFYYVTSGSNVTRVTVFYQQIENSNIANQIHGFTIDYGKFILITFRELPVRKCAPKPGELLHRNREKQRTNTSKGNIHSDNRNKNDFSFFSSKYFLKVEYTFCVFL